MKCIDIDTSILQWQFFFSQSSISDFLWEIKLQFLKNYQLSIFKKFIEFFLLSMPCKLRGIIQILSPNVEPTSNIRWTCFNQSETGRSRSHGSPSRSVFARTHETYVKAYVSFCIVTRGVSPLLLFGGPRPFRPSAPRVSSSGHALSPLPWIPAVITPLLHRHQNGGWTHPTVQGGRTWLFAPLFIVAPVLLACRATL